jgi:hypothetical protein
VRIETQSTRVAVPSAKLAESGGSSLRDPSGAIATIHPPPIRWSIDQSTLLYSGPIRMATLQEYRCEVCGIVTTSPMHWFVIQCGDKQLTVLRWDPETANADGARHYCGEANAQVYISRWFDSVCSPPKPDFTRRRGA